MQNLQGECVFSSEFDKMAQRTYYANFGEYPLVILQRKKLKDGFRQHLTYYVQVFHANHFQLQEFQRKIVRKEAWI
jgi:DNA (cytosine-5)-methyltransferase 1